MNEFRLNKHSILWLPCFFEKNLLIIFHNLFILGAYFLSKEGKGLKEL